MPQKKEWLLRMEYCIFPWGADGGRILNVAVSIDEQFQIRQITQYYTENEEEWSSEYAEYTLF